VAIENSYFEGGNLIYLPEHKILLHGDTPDGYYFSPDKLSAEEVCYCSPIEPKETTRQLSKQLLPFNIRTYGLETNPIFTVRNATTKTLAAYYLRYYHLDCFMHLLPDGRLLILNKKILSDASSNMLKAILGDKLIDLAYEEYLEKPVILNLVAVTRQDSPKITLISNRLPEEIIYKLEQLNLTVITPDTLQSSSARYNQEFSYRVKKALEAAGYMLDDKHDLLSSLPIKQAGYDFEITNITELLQNLGNTWLQSFKLGSPTFAQMLMEFNLLQKEEQQDGKKVYKSYHLPPSISQDIKKCFCVSLSFILGTFHLDFVVGCGGVHCLSIEIHDQKSPKYNHATNSSTCAM
jgi:hypothetical protein